MKEKKSPTGRRLLRSLTACGAAVAIGACMVPSAAFAAVNYNESGVPTYKLPTHAMALEQTLKDAQGHSYTQSYISSTGGRWSKACYSILGINNITGESNGGTGTNVNGTTTSTEYGLYGTDANINPDAFMYNMCAALNGVAVPNDMQAQMKSTVSVEIDGTAYNMPRDIYGEIDIIQSDNAQVSSGGHTYAEWIELENKREGRTRTTPYNPTFVRLSATSGGTYTVTAGEWGMAKTVDQVIVDSKDANGNYTIASRYADGPETWKVAADFEDITKGLQYYILSEIEKGTVKQKTVAVICGFDSNTHCYAVRKLNTGIEGDISSNSYAGRLASAVGPIGKDLNSLGLPTAQDPFVGQVNGRDRDESAYVGWYTAEQIAENCDAAFICDAPGGNGVSNYLATGTSGKAEAAYNEENLQYLTKAQSDARAKGKKAADICVNWPKIQFNCFYAQGPENLMVNFISGAYLYPEILDLTDCMAWWAHNIWHINDASLQDMVDSTCYNISLSSNQTKIGTISSNYEADLSTKINQGNVYYLANEEKLAAWYSGNIKTYDIDNLRTRTLAKIELSGTSFTYTGKAITPSVTVYDGNGILTEGKDYTVEYADNVNVGTARVVITGIGNHTRQTVATFDINAVQGQTIAASPASKTYKLSAVKKAKQTLSVKVTGAKTTLTATPNAAAKKAKITAKVNSKSKVTISVPKGTKKGTYKVSIAAKASNSYKASAAKTITIKVN